MTLLSLRGVQAGYGASQVLFGIDLSLAEGEVATLLGRNGMGKTTLLKCLMGLLPVRSGAVTFGGEDLTRMKPHQRARAGIAYVPQGREIFARLTVEENLLIAIAATGQRERAVPGWVYETFPILKQFARRRGGDLSGGQQQQLAIARALVTRPRLLILDEPTEGIQPNVIQDIERVIAGLAQQRAMAILLVEQYYEFARSLADRYVVLQRGVVVGAGLGANMGDDGVQRMLAV
jgi:urea transport system ATP-binding protein